MAIPPITHRFAGSLCASVRHHASAITTAPSAPVAQPVRARSSQCRGAGHKATADLQGLATHAAELYGKPGGAVDLCEQLAASAGSQDARGLDEEIRSWWRAVAAAPALVTALEGHHDIPAFFLQHEQLLDQFVSHLQNSPALLVELRPVLLVSPGEIVVTGCDAELVVRPLLQAIAAFIETCYTEQLNAYRRACRLADLRQPQSWFPAARKLKRQWHIHLGPTNSGKTHAAALHLLAASSGIYMSPLRLLAWEMYDKMRQAGLRCALRTGQESIGPEDATHVACTIEMTPLGAQVGVAVIDEVQMIVDPSRGAAWTRALLGVQARDLHLCGSVDPPGLVELLRNLALDCGDQTESKVHERMAPLVVEERPLEGLDKVVAGDCVVCFTRHDVLQTKSELEQLGVRTCAIYGSLPPEVRRDQAALFNDPSSGHDVLVASDAIGMGLNLHIRRVVFRSLQKFDGETTRQLSGAELRQVAGRAGRYGGRYGNVGLVTSLSPQDQVVIFQALESISHVAVGDVQESAQQPRAALFPLPEQLEAFSYALEADIGRLLPFAELVERFIAIAALSPTYFMARARNVLTIAKSLADIRLPPADKLVFCQAPVADRDALALACLHDFAREHAAGCHVVFPLVADQLPEASSASASPRKILELEGLFRVCDLYTWLACRFHDTFTDLGAARSVRSLLAERLGDALRLPLAEPTDEEESRSMITLHPMIATGSGVHASFRLNTPTPDDAFIR